MGQRLIAVSQPLSWKNGADEDHLQNDKDDEGDFGSGSGIKCSNLVPEGPTLHFRLLQLF